MGLLRECLSALRARQGAHKPLDDDASLIEAAGAQPPHRDTAAAKTVPSKGQPSPHGENLQAVPRRGD